MSWESKDFEQLIASKGPHDGARAGGSDETLPKRVAQLKLNSIVAALEKSKGQKSAAAKLLGISRSTLYEKLRELGLSEKLTDGD